MSHLLFNFHANQELFRACEQALRHTLNSNLIRGDYTLRQFPDGESYLRVLSDCRNANAVILCNLHQPNAKLLPLIFLCETLKARGIEHIDLLCPYLPYMRQDIEFKPGECVSSRYFAKILSQSISRLVTIDPHLHRYHSLDEIYSVPSIVLSSNRLIANWVKQHIESPLIIGPDSESEQWAADTANMIDCPYIILQKERFSDKDVRVSAPHASAYQAHTPVLIDDIISTGRTMIQTANALVEEGLNPPVCIGVHALFSDDAYEAMKTAPIAKIISCNTIAHQSNQIDISSLLVSAIT